MQAPPWRLYLCLHPKMGLIVSPGQQLLFRIPLHMTSTPQSEPPEWAEPRSCISCFRKDQQSQPLICLPRPTSHSSVHSPEEGSWANVTFMRANFSSQTPSQTAVRCPGSLACSFGISTLASQANSIVTQTVWGALAPLPTSSLPLACCHRDPGLRPCR